MRALCRTPIRTSQSRPKSHLALVLVAGVVPSRVNVEVLDGQAVLLGVVSGHDERRNAEQAAKGVKEVKGIINWLLLPEKEYMSIRSSVL